MEAGGEQQLQAIRHSAHKAQGMPQYALATMHPHPSPLDHHTTSLLAPFPAALLLQAGSQQMELGCE
jgi:hypothetical protein